MSMSLFGSLSRGQFLKEYWQKKYYLFQQAMPDVINIINGNDLAGLACDVESRIIYGNALDGQWACDNGPFDESVFSALPENNWTLLVQGLDQYSEDVRSILHRFDFLPQWRLEDIMASYAPMGGGVGPHFDYYDVFLLQISGEREWKLGQFCNERSVLQENPSVKLLQSFETSVSHIVKAGDMIYIPAGQAHWGTATSNDCITFSIGFRAPSEREIISATLDNLIDTLSDSKRYRDNIASIDPHPAKINTSVHQQLKHLADQLVSDEIAVLVQQSFGELVSEPRYSNEMHLETFFSAQMIQQLAQKSHQLYLEAPPHTRIAFSDTQLFINGESYDVDERFSQQLYRGMLSIDVLNDKHSQIIADLLNKGDLVLAGD